MTTNALAPAAGLDRLIHTVRGRRVMLDRDLARIYGVLTKNLNKAVKRNIERFPEDFMFRLSAEEASRFQIGTLKRGRNIKHRPHAYTEHGAVMLASVLRSPVAVEASINVVRAFNRLRGLAEKNKSLAVALAALEREFREHAARADSRFDDHARRLETLFAAVHEIMEPPTREGRKIGFAPD